MQSRNERHLKLLELIGSDSLKTQAALQRALKKSGFDVNQATLSRDIRELGLIKIAIAGEYRYVSRPTVLPKTAEQTALATVKRFIRTIDHAGNLVVVKCDDGAAAHVAAAIDGLALQDLLGSVAGDNTLILVVANGFRPDQVVRKLQSLTA